MPKVKQSAFCCPSCGEPTRVLRTRSALATRLIRYRICSAGHRITTRETVEIAPMRLALTKLSAELQNSMASPSKKVDILDNSAHGDQNAN